MLSGPRTTVLLVGAPVRRLADDPLLSGVDLVQGCHLARAASIVRDRQGRVDVIVVSSEGDARAVLRCIRSTAREWPWIPVIAVSHTRRARFIREAFQAGARDVLPPPLRLGELAHALFRLGHDSVAGGGDPSHAAVDRARAELERGYADAVSARALAAACGLSRWRFSRQFREVTGMSFRDYRLAVRLAHARELLLSSRRSITDIAHDVGFYDLAHFDHTFRERFGMTPRTFRRHRIPSRSAAPASPARVSARARSK